MWVWRKQNGEVTFLDAAVSGLRELSVDAPSPVFLDMFTSFLSVLILLDSMVVSPHYWLLLLICYSNYRLNCIISMYI